MTFSEGDIVLPAEQIAFCVEDGCHRLARAERPVGMVGDTPVVELVCEKHKHIQ